MGCRNATALNASPDAVWNALKDFHDLSWAPNVVTSVTRVGDIAGDSVGAKRVLNDAFHETLHELDHEARYLRYSIDNGPGPLETVTGYFGEVAVIPATPDADKAIVVWTSDWASEDGGVGEFCDPIYRALLTDLNAHFS